jgi:hypothetical protein
MISQYTDVKEELLMKEKDMASLKVSLQENSNVRDILEERDKLIDELKKSQERKIAIAEKNHEDALIKLHEKQALFFQSTDEESRKRTTEINNLKQKLSEQQRLYQHSETSERNLKEEIKKLEGEINKNKMSTTVDVHALEHEKEIVKSKNTRILE